MGKPCTRPLVVALICAASACGGAPPKLAAVVWDDERGDVTRYGNLPDMPLPDFTRVLVNAANGELSFVFQNIGPLGPVFSYTAPDGRKRGSVLASIYVDTDNNPATGGAPFARNTEGLADRKGYDRQIQVQLGFLYTDSGGGSGMTTGEGSIDTHEVQVTAPTANYYVFQLTPERQAGTLIRPESIGLDRSYRDLTTLGDDTVEIRVPFAALGIKSGDTVRVCYHDTLQSPVPETDAVARDQTLRIP